MDYFSESQPDVYMGSGTPTRTDVAPGSTYFSEIGAFQFGEDGKWVLVATAAAMKATAAVPTLTGKWSPPPTGRPGRAFAPHSGLLCDIGDPSDLNGRHVQVDGKLYKITATELNMHCAPWHQGESACYLLEEVGARFVPISEYANKPIVQHEVGTIVVSPTGAARSR